MPLHSLSSLLLFNVGMTLQNSWPFSEKSYACIECTKFFFLPLFSKCIYTLLRCNSLLDSDYHGHMNLPRRFMLVYSILLLMIDMD